MRARRVVGGLLVVIGIVISAWAYFGKDASGKITDEVSAWSDEDRTPLEVIYDTGIMTGLPLVGLGALIAQWPER